MWKGEIKIMGYLARLEQAQDDVTEIIKDFTYEQNNEETIDKITEKITQIFRDNKIFDNKESTLEEAGWTVYTRETNDRFNNISITLCVNLEMGFHLRDMSKD